MIEARRIAADAVALETLESVGRFITFMQRPSGGLFSKYDELHGMDRQFDSLYYHGEAILALTMHFEHTKDQRLLDSAARVLPF